jgi:hypothetical protein
MPKTAKTHGLSKENILSALGNQWVYRTTKTNRYYENTATGEKISRRKALDRAIAKNPNAHGGKTKYAQVSPSRRKRKIVDESKVKGRWKKAHGALGDAGWKVKEYESVSDMAAYVEEHPGIYFVTTYGSRPARYTNTNTGEEVSAGHETKAWVSLVGRSYYTGPEAADDFINDIDTGMAILHPGQMESFDKFALYKSSFVVPTE